MQKPTLAVVIAALALAAVFPPTGSGASLDAQFGTDSSGMVEVPAISQLASHIAGRQVTVYCYPSSAESMEQGYTQPVWDAAAAAWRIAAGTLTAAYDR